MTEENLHEANKILKGIKDLERGIEALENFVAGEYDFTSINFHVGINLKVLQCPTDVFNDIITFARGRSEGELAILRDKFKKL